MDSVAAQRQADEISEKRLAQLRRRNAELEILYETIQDLTSTLSVKQVLDRILDRTLRHLDAEIGSILLRGPDARLRVVAACGLPQEIARLRQRLRRDLAVVRSAPAPANGGGKPTA